MKTGYENGNKYFYNSETLDTMWDNPAEVELPLYRVKMNAIALLVDEDRVANFLGAQPLSTLAPVPEEEAVKPELDVIATRTSSDGAVGHLVQTQKNQQKKGSAAAAFA